MSNDDNLYDDYSDVDKSHGVPLKDAEATYPPEADWEGHDMAIFGVGGGIISAGENPFSIVTSDLENHGEWSEADIEDALRKALNEVRGWR